MENPIRNYTKLLVRLCTSDEHLLLDSPKLHERNLFELADLHALLTQWIQKAISDT